VWLQGSADMVCPCPPLTLLFDRLTLKLVCHSHLKWGTFLPNLGTLGLWVLELSAMYAKATLIAPFPTAEVIISAMVVIMTAHYKRLLLTRVCVCCLVIASEPSFDVPLVNVTVVAGQSIVLQCSIDNLGNYKVSMSISRISCLLSLSICM